MLGVYIILFIFIFLFGIVIGSFLNVCIIRIPNKESIVTVNSHCMTCGYNLKWYDLIPIFSYLFLRGKCRKCGEKISSQYPIIEAINGIVYVLIFFRFGFDDLRSIIISIIYCLVFSGLLVLTLIDWRTYEIPLGINIYIGVLGVIFTCFDYKNIISHIIGIFAISIPLLIIFLISKGRAMGGGDIKLMAVAGLLLGWKSIILAFVVACIVGSIIHIIRMKVSGESRVLALGPYLSFGIMISIFFGDYIVGFYTNLLNIA